MQKINKKMLREMKTTAEDLFNLVDDLVNDVAGGAIDEEDAIEVLEEIQDLADQVSRLTNDCIEE